ncbi:phosphotransferase family protein [Microtetraspora malaysiensis]|uniref:phosphotransferase family protein n=1 Tax=Microtetraspora malaysiensis TaxID=161358 RepID=UPI003D926858
MTGRWSTHAIEIQPDQVIKRFRSRDRGEPDREWRALQLLSQYAAGLAPDPLHADLDADPAVVVMSRLPGMPLRGTRVTAEQLTALRHALTTVYTSIPAAVVQAEPPRRGHAGELVDLLRVWCRTPPRGPAVVRTAFAEGSRWLDTCGDAVASADVVPVFGVGDGNLANALWDGSRVRMLDFEESGRSDRAFELAEMAEHVSAWVDTEFDVSAFLEEFELTSAETTRLRECRRLFALMWLIMLARDDPANPRNPSGTTERQAHRLLAVLGEMNDS